MAWNLFQDLWLICEAQLSAALSGHWQAAVKDCQPSLRVENGKIKWDQYALFQVMNKFWAEAFKDVLTRTDRAIVNEPSSSTVTRITNISCIRMPNARWTR